MVVPITCTLTLRWMPLSLGEYRPSRWPGAPHAVAYNVYLNSAMAALSLGEYRPSCWPGAPYAAAYNVYLNSAMAAPVVGRVPAVTLAESALWCCL